MLTLNAPAKLNLFLAVTGLRPDGFHNLVSFVVPLELHDTLSLNFIPEAGPDTLQVEGDAFVPLDGLNTILKAAQAFRIVHPFPGRVEFFLKKAIPSEAGLGGGSSDAVAALKGLNMLLSNPLTASDLAALAAQVGSDCPLFINPAPSVIRGRGEAVSSVPLALAASLQGQRLYLFKPDFSISTPWAYAQLKAAQAYTSPVEAEAALQSFVASLETVQPHFTNDFLKPLAFKYPLIPLFLEHMTNQGFVCGLSGSGSACFIWLKEDTSIAALDAQVTEAFGPHCFRVQTRLV